MAVPAGFAAMADVLRGYGLDSLVDWAFKQFVDGRSMDEVMLDLETQPVVQQKFSAVFERRKQGLPPISFADVVSYQDKANQYESYYGIPHGFVDVNRLLVNSVSQDELGARIAQTADVLQSTRPDVAATLQQWGLSEGDAIAYALDPDTGLPAVTRRFLSAKVATQAQKQFGAISEAEATALTGQGVTEAQATSGFGTLGKYAEVTQQLAGEQAPGMSRTNQLDVVAGAQPATTELQKRARGRAGVFEETAGLAASNSGVVGAGTSSKL